MNQQNNDSLLEIALELMKNKRKPRTLDKITKEAFEVKGLSTKDAEDKLAQFKSDFMLSGYFICCGEDKNKNKLWDIKARQPSSLLDKDGSYLEDPYDDDEEVIKNELSDDIIYSQGEKDFDDDKYNEDDDEEENEEEQTDEIEEELMSGEYYRPLTEDEDDDLKDDEEEEEDEIAEELLK